VRSLPRGELVGGATIGKRAAGAHVGHHHRLVGVQYLGRFGHEVHARKADHVGVGLGCGLRELQRIADEVGDVLDLAVLVVVGQQHGVALFFQARDLGFEVQ
jgi:hypothetical protein